MAYTINKTDGSVLATITDGTINNTSSLTLFGKSYSGFGELLNENLVKLLENQSSTAAPTAPLKGELWFDTSNSILKVYDGSAFKPAGGSKSSATAPTTPGAGDLLTTCGTHPGCVQKALSPVLGSIVGKAMENKEDAGESVILISVGRL